ncbi:MAG: DUF1330 domain-containing protein [Pseudomonadota bacterium]
MTNYVDPTREQFGDFMKVPDDGPIWMLNLIKLKDKATYEDGREATGREAYQAYGKESGPIFKGVGGKIAWTGTPKAVLIGPESDLWDVAFIAEYPSAEAFSAMVKDPAYQAIVYHRQAAVGDSRLIRIQPGNSGENFG